MLDIEYIRNHPEEVKAGARKKRVDVNIDRLLEVDKQRRQHLRQRDELRQQRNTLAHGSSGPPSQEAIEEGKQLKQQIADLDARLDQLEQEYQALMLEVPNPPHQDVPEGEDDSENLTVLEWGERPDFSFTPKDHVELGQQRDLLDLEAAAHTSGSRFYYLKNDAARLDMALSSWAMQKLTDKGFNPALPPQLVREHMMTATGFFPADRNEIYHVNPDEDDLYLIGTSEVSLAGLHMNDVLDAGTLPRRYAGYSSCYRREAGSYGKDTRGIIRVHQFNKVEMFVFADPEHSWEEHEWLLAIEEELLQELGLAYRVVNICGGDLGAPAAKKYDCEAWLPSQQRYLELTSCSNTTDFQARRGSIKYEGDDGDRDFAHTLNGTAVATTRTLVVIMEQYQTESGTIRVPDVLQPYLGKEEIT